MKYFITTFWIITIIGFNIINLIKTETQRLHHLMDNNELEYYLNIKNLNDINNIPDYDVIHLKNIQIYKRKKRHINNISESLNNELYSLKFHAFDRPIHLKLKPNKNLISKNMKIWIHDGNKRKIMNDNFEFKKDCYFLHRDQNSVASLNNCEDDRKYHGIILTSNDTFEIVPLNIRLQRELQKQNNISNLNIYESAHIIKRVSAPEIIPNLSRLKRSVEPLQNTIQNITTDQLLIQNITTDPFQQLFKIHDDDDAEKPESRIIKKQNVRFTVEIGVFFDEPAYKIFSPLFNRDNRKLSEMLLAYMNGVQALYHHNSLGSPIDITIVHMEIMRRQPPSCPHHNGERDQLLDSFCSYQQRINSPTDDDSGHWDMGLYISGLDFFSNEDGIHSGATMGLATVRGVCSGQYACVIVEFGATNAFGRPYPSAGFNSVYIAAHEIGHNLGMSHDASGNYCPKDGFIMSPSRGTQGETIWSSCSADIVRSLGTWATCLNDRPKSTPAGYNAWHYNGYPGQNWSAKKQCEILIADVDAMPMQTTNLQGICQNLECRSPHKSGFFFAGPALEGTDCGTNNWCEGGNCVYKTRIPNSGPVIIGGMGQWKNEKCVSGCLVKSKGGQGRRRACDNPKPQNTLEGCEGTTYDVTLCSDTKICQGVRRKTPAQFASRKCKQFSKKIPDLDPKGVGLQAHHENHRLWMGCAIFCRRRGGSFYTPRMNLNEIGENAYFPDGTLCHSINNENYYCMQHHCLPEGFQFNKNNFWLLSEDVPISGNANPNFTQIYNKKLIDYLSIDENGKALRAHLTPDDVREQRGNEQWIDDLDYRIVPSLYY